VQGVNKGSAGEGHTYYRRDVWFLEGDIVEFSRVLGSLGVARDHIGRNTFKFFESKGDFTLFSTEVRLGFDPNRDRA
jgi:hypothetical protein